MTAIRIQRRPPIARVCTTFMIAALAALCAITIVSGSAFGAESATTSAAKSPSSNVTVDDALPSSSAHHLRVAAAVARLKPGTFTISGMKYLEGRALEANEFSFSITAAGAYSVPTGSPLKAQLQEGSSLSKAEKYGVVANGGLQYQPSEVQPMPASRIATNAANGSITFDPITFDRSSLGNAATKRSFGTIFYYTISEQPPCDADGTPKVGAIKDAHGQYVYEGVTYDDSVKHVYLYAYETGTSAADPHIAVVPLGDYAFDNRSSDPQPGAGDGFLNTFRSTCLAPYDGVVFLEGEPIEAGEFNFDVREVTEDGKLLEEGSVACEATAGGATGAEVPILSDEVYTMPNRVFYAVSQAESTRAEEENVTIDETSYVITVEITEEGDGLDSRVTAVRKKAADSDTWIDVDLNLKPAPVIWENKIAVAEEEPSDPSDDGETAGSITEHPEGTPPSAGSSSTPSGTDGAADDANTGSGTANGTAPESPAPSESTDPASHDASGSSAASANDAADDATASSKRHQSTLTETGDELAAFMAIMSLILVASALAAMLSARRMRS